jgi:hypothetical protein
MNLAGPTTLVGTSAEQDADRAPDPTPAQIRRLVHDCNNVLTTITGFSELALTQAPPDSRLRQYVLEILQGAEHATKLLAELGVLGKRSGVLQAAVGEQPPMRANPAARASDPGGLTSHPR